ELAPPLPQDIAFGSQRPQPDAVVTGASIDGDFGFIVASDGTVYILNVDSQLGANVADNTFRDFNAGPLATQGGSAAVLIQPTQNFTLTDVPLPTRVSLGFGNGARVEAIVQDDFKALVKWVTFPDLTVASPQSWLASWEGAVTISDRARGSVLPPSAAAPAGSVLDHGQEFCQAGALPKDVVLLNGCSLDTECSTDGTSVCRQALPGTPGLCFAAGEAKNSDLITSCTRQLISRRRYEVVTSTPQRLDLALKPDELPKTALDRCQVDSDCQAPPFDGFACLQVRAGEPKRCVKPCRAMEGGQPDDRLCRPGTVCEQVDGTLTGPLCVEGPKIDPRCWPLGTAYEVQVGQSFLVSGSVSPRPATTKEEGGLCVPDLARNRLLVNRIPLDAPHCEGVPDQETAPNNTRDAFRATVPSGPPGTWGNPCLFWGVNDDDACRRIPVQVPDPNNPGKTITEYQVPPVAPSNNNIVCGCAPDANGRRPNGCHVKALFQNAELRFVFTNLEQYAGDANYSRFDVSGGFRPDFVNLRDDIIVTMGVRVVTGPMATPESYRGRKVGEGAFYFPYLYVLDQGRTASSGAGRGQILRINPRYGVLGGAQFDSNYSQFPFQIQ
ncbi:MAG TPA: hypothetical protein VN914_04130, partial [Polyangia bacterium]|nr:hypothetical protein [Polyangia bacterium]